jgi:radical SAM superfamily enzyme YgiQ (UPF0313 family)
LNITFIEPYATDDGTLIRKPAKDVYSLFRLPSRAVDLLAGICIQAGYPNTVSYNLQYTKGRGGLNSAVWGRLARSDVVGISAITRTASPAYALAKRVRLINPKALIVFGGPHTSALPREALQYGDVVIRREGDHTMLALLRRLQEHREPPCLSDVKGIAYLEGEEVVLTPPRPFLTVDEFNALPFPRFPPEVLKGISRQVMITSRGCPYGCHYCSVIENFGRSYRCHTPERMYAYYRYLTNQSKKDIFIGDDNFTANTGRVKAWCERILSAGKPKRGWSAQVRVEAARDDELLHLMKRAGCQTVMIGLESVNNETLRLWNKRSSLEKNTEAIRRFNAARIGVHGMFVLGSEMDSLTTVRKTVDFAKRLNIASAQFFSLTPLPGTPLTRKYNEDGCILSKKWMLYDGQHVMIEPGKMSPADLQRGIIQAHKAFYSWREGIRHLFLPGSHQRFFNFLIRIMGKPLTRKICKAAKPHLKALDDLEKWKKEFNSQIAGLREGLRRLAGSISDDMVLRKEKFLALMDQTMDRLRENMISIKQEYHPYCRKLLDSLRSDLLKETEAVLA